MIPALNTSQLNQDKDKQFYHFSVYYKPILNTKPAKVVTLEDVHKVVISNKYKEVTNKIKSLTNKSARNDIKKQSLDFVTFSGIFTERTTDELKQHSNLLCIDIDDIENVNEVKQNIIDILPPSLMFVSPSGNGLKAVYKINIAQADHFKYFKAFEQFFSTEFNIIIDDKCKDIVRSCFLCYDNEAYLNTTTLGVDISFINTFYVEEEKTPQNKPIAATNQIITDYDVIINNLKKWLDKKESFITGNRNNYISQLAAAYNRYGIPKNEALNDLLNYSDIDFKDAEIKATVKSIYKNTAYHNKAQFEINQPYQFDDIPTVNKEKTKTPLLPIDGLPELIQNFINDYENVYKTPRDYIAASVLFSTALAIGDKIELKGKYDNIPLLWLAIVGNVSSGKTDPLKSCLKYFSDRDSKAIKVYQRKLKEYNAYTKLSKKDKEITDEVKEPLYFQYILNDYTPEALYNVHSINDRGLSIYRDELKGWLDDFGRYSKSGEQSTMLSTFYQQPMQINRASKGPININKPCIYVAGGIQPELLKDLAKDNRAENGFLSRFIFAYPYLDNKPYFSDKKLDPQIIKNYHALLEQLTNMTKSEKIVLSDGASEVYKNWYNNNADLTNKEPSGYLKGVYGKLDVYALRLAIVVHGMDYICNGYEQKEISEKSMQTAIDLTEYFRFTSLKVYNKIFKDTKSQFSKKEIAKYLHTLGNSQNQIAVVLGVSQQYVQKVLKE